MAKKETKTTNEMASTASTGENPSSENMGDVVSSSVKASPEKEPRASGSSEEPSPKKESVYTVDEFCNNAEVLFQTKSECVRAALTQEGIEQCTKERALSIVSAFMKKEVK